MVLQTFAYLKHLHCKMMFLFSSLFGFAHNKNNQSQVFLHVFSLHLVHLTKHNNTEIAEVIMNKEKNFCWKSIFEITFNTADCL